MPAHAPKSRACTSMCSWLSVALTLLLALLLAAPGIRASSSDSCVSDGDAHAPTWAWHSGGSSSVGQEQQQPADAAVAPTAPPSGSTLLDWAAAAANPAAVAAARVCEAARAYFTQQVASLLRWLAPGPVIARFGGRALPLSEAAGGGGAHAVSGVPEPLLAWRGQLCDGSSTEEEAASQPPGNSPEAGSGDAEAGSLEPATPAAPPSEQAPVCDAHEPLTAWRGPECAAGARAARVAATAALRAFTMPLAGCGLVDEVFGVEEAGAPLVVPALLQQLQGHLQEALQQAQQRLPPVPQQLQQHLSPVLGHLQQLQQCLSPVLQNLQLLMQQALQRLQQHLLQVQQHVQQAMQQMQQHVSPLLQNLQQRLQQALQQLQQHLSPVLQQLQHHMQQALQQLQQHLSPVLQSLKQHMQQLRLPPAAAHTLQRLDAHARGAADHVTRALRGSGARAAAAASTARTAVALHASQYWGPSVLVVQRWGFGLGAVVAAVAASGWLLVGAAVAGVVAATAGVAAAVVEARAQRAGVSALMQLHKRELARAAEHAADAAHRLVADAGLAEEMARQSAAQANVALECARVEAASKLAEAQARADAELVAVRAHTDAHLAAALAAASERESAQRDALACAEKEYARDLDALIRSHAEVVDTLHARAATAATDAARATGAATLRAQRLAEALAARRAHMAARREAVTAGLARLGGGLRRAAGAAVHQARSLSLLHATSQTQLLAPLGAVTACARRAAARGSDLRAALAARDNSLAERDASLGRMQAALAARESELECAAEMLEARDAHLEDMGQRLNDACALLSVREHQITHDRQLRDRLQGHLQEAEEVTWALEQKLQAAEVDAAFARAAAVDEVAALNARLAGTHEGLAVAQEQVSVYAAKFESTLRQLAELNARLMEGGEQLEAVSALARARADELAQAADVAARREHALAAASAQTQAQAAGHHEAAREQLLAREDDIALLQAELSELRLELAALRVTRPILPSEPQALRDLSALNVTHQHAAAERAAKGAAAAAARGGSGGGGAGGRENNVGGALGGSGGAATPPPQPQPQFGALQAATLRSMR
ncbi:hypothetical protein FOA52_004804 [Chlamydomonas sp. UWO 241]|nr:hypothetical protein FOA52_004804 [Chlamydomonas sp. UWO 241]